ncbi:hypothetical protein [Streptomyces sp. NPDC002067]
MSAAPMHGSAPGPDEIRMRLRLRAAGVGPDARGTQIPARDEIPPPEPPELPEKKPDAGRLPPPGKVVDLDQLGDQDWWRESEKAPEEEKKEDRAEQPPSESGRTDAADADEPEPEPDNQPQSKEQGNPEPETTPEFSLDPVDIANRIVRGHLERKAEGDPLVHRLVEAVESLEAHLAPQQPARKSALQAVWDTARPSVRWLAYNCSAAAASYVVPRAFGRPDLSLPTIAYDLISAFTVREFHWSTGLIVSGILLLLVWIIWDRHTRGLKYALGWLARIPLAATGAGSAAAVWKIVVHLLTGAPL